MCMGGLLRIDIMANKLRASRKALVASLRLSLSDLVKGNGGRRSVQTTLTFVRRDR